MEQMTINSILFETYNIKKPVRLIELFGGIGSQAKALTNLGVDFEHHLYCDFDKHSVKSYNAIFGTDFTPTDITKLTGEDLKIVETDKYEYIMTYSFPCQDLSLAGKGAGMNKGDNTRSGLLWEVERLLKETKELPQILLMENVTQVISKENIYNFNIWREFLESLGYSNYVQNLIATDYGIPQTRDRTFMISILGEYNYNFPKPFKLEKKLKDFLEDNVGEKYYLSEKMIKYITSNNKNYTGNNDKSIINKTISSTITTREGNVRCDVSNYIADNLPSDFNLKTYKKEVGVIKKDTENYIEWEEKGKLDMFNRAWKSDKVISTLHSKSGDIKVLFKDLRIRKITPLESWRLMGFDDDDFYKAQAVNSDSQLYKQAGNSIVVDVLENIFKQLL